VAVLNRQAGHVQPAAGKRELEVVKPSTIE
jgi:hypothetical protein